MVLIRHAVILVRVKSGQKLKHAHGGRHLGALQGRSSRSVEATWHRPKQAGHLVACGDSVAIRGVPGCCEGVVQVPRQAVYMAPGAQIHNEGFWVIPDHHHL